MVVTQIGIDQKDCKFRFRNEDAKHTRLFTKEVVAKRVKLTAKPGVGVSVAGIRVGLLVRATLDTNVYLPVNTTDKAKGAFVPWGGQCQCPNGAVYDVASQKNAFSKPCDELACYGGTVLPGTCGARGIGGVGIGMEVTCFANPRDKASSSSGDSSGGSADGRVTTTAPDVTNTGSSGGNDCPGLPDWVVADNLFQKEMTLDITGEFDEEKMDPGGDSYDLKDGFLPVTSDWAEVAAAFGKKQAGTFQVTYTAIDKSGNKITKDRTVVLKDATPPTATLIGDADSIVEAQRGQNVEDEGATAEDIIDKDVTASITAEVLHSYDPQAPVTFMTKYPFVDRGRLGKFAVVYTAVDKTNNEGTAIRAIIVQDTTAPTLELLSKNEDEPELNKGLLVGATDLDKWLEIHTITKQELARESFGPAPTGNSSGASTDAVAKTKPLPPDHTFAGLAMSWNCGIPWQDPLCMVTDNHLNTTELSARMKVSLEDIEVGARSARCTLSTTR